MRWIDIKNKAISPEEGKTYWVTVDFMGGFVIAASWFKGKWHADGRTVHNVIAWYDEPQPAPFVLPPKKGMEFPEFEQGENGVNVKIKVHIMPDDIMKKAGFRIVESVNRWVYFRPLKKEISFNVGININDESDFRIDVLDEDFCQPYDYQHILETDRSHKFAKEIFSMVEDEMEKLKSFGIIEGHEYGEYI